MAEQQEKQPVTGLELASNRKEAEYDLVKSLLSAMDYKEDEQSIVEVELRRNGVFLFTVHLHPLSDDDIRFARKKSNVYVPNPNNKKLPMIVKETDETKLKSWVIYLATTEDDQQKIWGNKAVKDKAGLMENYESIGVLCTAGEKNALFNKVCEISGLDDDLEPDEETMDEEEFAKN